MNVVMLALTTYDNREITLDHGQVCSIEEIISGARIGLKNGQTFEVIETPKQIRQSILRAHEAQEKYEKEMKT